MTRVRSVPDGSTCTDSLSGKIVQSSERKWGILMTSKSHNADIDVVTAGRAVYEKLRERLEATDKGNFVVIDAVSGDYEVDPSPASAKRRLKARQPGITTFTKRIGRPEVYKLVSFKLKSSNDD